MNNIGEKIIRIIGMLGWALVGLGCLFTIWAFMLVMRSSSAPLEPIWILFFITLIFCSIAVGMFFVVLGIIVKTLRNIEKNTEKQSSV